MIDKMKLTIEARPIAIRMAQEIAAIANAHPLEEIAPFAGLCSAMVLQNIICTLAFERFEPGSLAGAEFIKTTYEGVVLDALERWNKEDLKAYEKWSKSKKPDAT